MSVTYYFRTVDRDSLIQVGADLGILRVEGEAIVPVYPALAWDEIGHIYEPTGATLETDNGPMPETAPVTDENGTPYWHVNMQFDGGLLEHAEAECQRAEPERAARIAQHIADSTQYFVLDEFGQPRKPNSPDRVFWTQQET